MKSALANIADLQAEFSVVSEISVAASRPYELTAAEI